MIERQPRHHGGAWRGDLAIDAVVTGHNLFEIGEKILIRDHDTGRRARGTRGVLQVQDIRMAVSGRTRTGARPSIKIQPIDFDHRRCVLAGLRLDVFDDIVDDRGRRENDRRCGIGEHGNGALVVGTTLGNRKRNRDNSGLQRGNKANDIVEALWRQN
ncbi:Uncharacterised protein [Mycobacterium tuberculosis]|nr:Uncharacterised protein [Mycobacterium tuberculosis]